LEVVAEYGVARSWVYELLARYRAEGEAAFVVPANERWQSDEPTKRGFPCPG
jgi:hypothetical protein